MTDLKIIIPGFTPADLTAAASRVSLNPDANKNENAYMSRRINGFFQYEKYGGDLKASAMANFTWTTVKNPETGYSEPSKNILENPDLFIGTLNTDFSTLDLMKREAANPNPPLLRIMPRA